MTIVVVIAATLGALLAGRVFITVTRGAIARRRGFQHDRVAEVEPGLRRPLWLALVAAVAAVLVGLPGLHPFNIGSRRVAGLTFTALRALRQPSPGDRLQRHRRSSWRC